MSRVDVRHLEERYRVGLVWVLRVAVGVLFVMSGLAKCFDIWGTVYKIEEYLTVWGWMQPRSLVVCGALGLSVLELLSGVMLLTGSLRRVTVWVMIAMMAGMLPLTAYIFIADPVSDCGCFGDMWVISNGATFLKNIAITAALVYLAFFNRKVKGLYGVAAQWWIGVMTVLVGLWVGLYGFNVQPMADFRSFPVGSSVCPSYCEGVDESAFTFVYEKEGERREFSIDELPDSTWTFVERVDHEPEASDATLMTVYDGDADVTEDVLCSDGPMLIIVVPQRSRADLSYTYLINELQRVAQDCGGRMIELVDLESSESVEDWRDLSMAGFDIYTAESTVLKELSRGVASAVFVNDGVIRWKRNLASIGMDDMAPERGDDGEGTSVCDAMDPHTSTVLAWTLGLWLLMLVVVLAVDRMVPAKSDDEKSEPDAEEEKTSPTSDNDKE